MNGVDGIEHCPECAGEIPPGTKECPVCSSRGGLLSGPSRQAATLFSLLLLGALFIFTGFATQAFHRHEKELADEWVRNAQADLAAGDPNQALDALRNALVYSKDNREYQLRLAQTLVAANRDDEARPYLLSLWEHEPGNADVNLELARLAARRGDVAEALRYYHGSIYGQWDSNVVEQRRNTRLELIRYLTAHALKQQALSEIIALAANLPPDAALQAMAGNLFLEQGSFDRALARFREALRLDPKSVRALLGAGHASFEAGNFSDAEGYLERAIHLAPRDEQAAAQLEISRAVLSLDPYVHGLSAGARAQRALRDFALAQARLAGCIPPPGSAAAVRLADLAQRSAAIKTKVNPGALQRDMDLFDSAGELALDVETAVAQACGPGSTEDQALALIAKYHHGAAQ
ncbi:MAG TPA: tetratricopeptide repeat protein [Candidatus Acidoferrales bacterium]|nr:tetratricopeptide repeat protein [Candidatus Acidoferrales bacterium]